MSASSVPAEFPTLDLEELEEAPLRPAVRLGTVVLRELPGILAASLPGVVHARPADARCEDVYEFVDTATGAAVRYVLTWNECGDTEAMVAESGRPGLFDQIVAACTAGKGQRPASES